MSNQVQQKQKQKTAMQVFNGFITDDSTQKYLQEVLGTKKEKFVTNMVSMVSQNEKLAVCTPKSLMSSAIVATTLNLSLNQGFGFAYIIPYQKKKKQGNEWVVDKTEAQFQIGYKGYIQLAMRTGQYSRINATPIHENQFLGWNELEEELSLNNVAGNGKIVGYASYFRLTNGFEKKMYWNYEKMLNHADKYSQAFDKNSYEKIKSGKIAENLLYKYSSFWYKDFDEMANKTMLKQLLSKYGILTEELQQAITYDQAVIENDKPIYVDNKETLDARIEAVEREIDEDGVIELNSADEFAGMEPDW